MESTIPNRQKSVHHSVELYRHFIVILSVHSYNQFIDLSLSIVRIKKPCHANRSHSSCLLSITENITDHREGGASWLGGLGFIQQGFGLLGLGRFINVSQYETRYKHFFVPTNTNQF